MSAPTYTPFPVSVAIDDTLSDSVAIYFGTGADVGIDFDGTDLRLFDSGGDAIVTVDPATAALDLIFPGATTPAESPILSLYHDEASATQVATDDIGTINFDTKNSAGTRTTYAYIRGEFGAGTAGDELGVGVIGVKASGANKDMMRFFGNLSALPNISSVEFLDNFGSVVSGKGMLVAANQPAFIFDSLIGGLHTPTSAGLFFMAGGASPANGFEFREAGSGGVVARITVDGLGGVLVQGGTTTSHRGLDTLTAAQLNLCRNTATLVKTWQSLEVADAKNIVVGTTTGTKIGTAVSQKIGFWNKAPVVQPSGSAQAALTNSTGGTTDGTLAAVSGSGDDANINNNFAELHTLLDAIRTALVNTGLIKGAA